MRSWIAGLTVAIAMATPAAAGEGEASLPVLVPASQHAPAAGMTQPAVYTGAEAPVLTSTVDTGAEAISAAPPAPDFAWVLALGFLGLIVLRRTRAARAF